MGRCPFHAVYVHHNNKPPPLCAYVLYKYSSLYMMPHPQDWRSHYEQMHQHKDSIEALMNENKVKCSTISHVSTLRSSHVVCMPDLCEYCSLSTLTAVLASIVTVAGSFGQTVN